MFVEGELAIQGYAEKSRVWLKFERLIVDDYMRPFLSVMSEGGEQTNLTFAGVECQAPFSCPFDYNVNCPLSCGLS